MTRLANEDVAKLFTVPESEWTVINKRVGLAILVENIGAEMQKTLPSYPSLLLSSKQWRAITFPGIVTHSAEVAAYAGRSIDDFSSLRDRIAALPPGSTVVPDALASTVRQTLRRLHEQTMVHANTSSALAKAIDDFRIVNDAVDTDILRSPVSTWHTVSAQTRAVATAISHVEGTWSAITADLAVAAADTVVITMPFLTGLQLDVSIAAWQRIQIEATAFGSMVAGQQVYLNGRVA